MTFDKYENYIPEIFALLMQNQAVTVIADKLYEIETIIIGVIGNKEHCSSIAKELVTKKQQLIHCKN